MQLMFYWVPYNLSTKYTHTHAAYVWAVPGHLKEKDARTRHLWDTVFNICYCVFKVQSNITLWVKALLL